MLGIVKIRTGPVENHREVEEGKSEHISRDGGEKDKKKNNEQESNDRRSENRGPTYG